MTPALILELALFAFVALTIARSIVVVPAGSAYVVERFGHFAKTLPAGMHVIVPFVEAVRARHVLSERKQELEESAITRDNQVVRVKGVIRYEIVDPARATYGAADFASAPVALARTLVRGRVAERTLDQVREDVRQIAAEVADAFARDAEPWGLRPLGCDLELVR